jgi:DNA topoisomerase-1
MKLVILESPNKIKTLQKFLPPEYTVIASVGHIFQLPVKGLNISVEDRSFRPTIQPIPGKIDVLHLIRLRSDEADEVFICTDPDREGERIAFDVASLVQDKKKIRRAAFHEITKKAVLSAIAAPRDIDMNLVNSQITRQILDRLIGYIVSPMLWRAVPGGKSAGRVQSSALRLIADREIEIEAFVSDKFWDVPVTLSIGSDDVYGVVMTNEKGNRIPTVEQANMAKSEVEKSSPTVRKVTSKVTKRGSLPPLDTASMQKAASSTLNWSSKKTMDVAQALYEAGCITYHRTDSFSVSDEAYASCASYITSKYGAEYLPVKRPVYSKKSKSQEAHECIRPTTMSGELWADGVSLTPDDKTLLGLIHSRFLASQMADMEVRKTDVVVKTGRCNVLVEGKTIVFDGWTKACPLQGKETFLPDMKEGDPLTVKEVQSKEHETRPPDRFNDGSLVTKMEKEGVGRPSTWATLVESLEKRSYVTRVGKNFHLTPVGRSVYKFLMGKFSEFFMDIGFTSDVEDDLERISEGGVDKMQVITSFYDKLHYFVNKEHIEMFEELFGK